MEPSAELIQRKQSLLLELERAIRKETLYAQINHLFSNTIMTLAVGCSIAAAGVGVFGQTAFSSKLAGGLAIFPPLLALAALNLKLDSKMSWQYRKRDALSALRSQLLYQLPELPSVDDIAAVARAWQLLNEKMQREWDKLRFNWSGLQNRNANDSSSKSRKDPA